MEFTGKLKRMDRRHFNWSVGWRERGVPCQYLVMPFRAILNFRHWFVQSCKFLLVFLGFLQAKETNGVLDQAKISPTWHEIAGHFNIIKWTQWETDLCGCFVIKPTEPISSEWSWSWIKHATGVGALSKTCSKGKLWISSLHLLWYRLIFAVFAH